MTTWKDLFIRFLLFIGVAIVSLIFIASNNFAVMVPVALLMIFSYQLILKKLKDKKRISSLIKNDLAAMNYTIISERPLTIKEQYENYEWDLGFNYLEGISTSSWLYKAKMLRHFVVRNEKEHEFELIITIVQTWRNKFIFKINSTSRLRD
jgi:hypothetical protein